MARYRADFVKQLPDSARLIENTDCYYVTPDGDVYSTARGKKIRKLKTWKDKKGYLYTALYQYTDENVREYKHHYIHQLVAETFIGKQDGEINHKNCCKTDNRVENLEWCTHKENMQHAWSNGLIKITDEVKKKISKANKGHYARKGKDNSRSKSLGMYDYATDKLIETFDSKNEAKRKLGKSSISLGKPAKSRLGYYFLYL